MIEIRSKDYFKLTYDTAAQNRVSSLSGKTYVRTLVERQQSVTVTEVELTDGTIIQLPYNSKKFGADIAPDPYDNYTYFNPYDIKRDIRFGEGVSYPLAGQSITLAKADVLFKGFVLPEEEEKVTVELSYATKHKTIGYILNGKELSGTKLTEKFQELWDAKEAEEGLITSETWDSLWIGCPLRRTESGSTRDQYFQWYVECDQWDNESVFPFYPGSHVYFKTYINLADDEVVQEYKASSDSGITILPSLGAFDWIVDRVINNEETEVTYTFHGKDVNLIRTSVVRYRTGGYVTKARVYISRLPILNIQNSTYTGSASSYIAQIQEWLESFTVTLKYKQYEWVGEDFSIEGATDDLFPYKFPDAQVANKNDTVGGVSWDSAYKELVFNKYLQGKRFVELKIKAAFALEKGIKLETPIRVYDLENRPISRDGVPCTFRVKRLVKAFNDNDFYYIINCLED